MEKGRGDQGEELSAAAAAAQTSAPTISQVGELRYVAVESVRALAAIGVVVAHCWGASGHIFFGEFENRLVSGLGFGAFMFFALSGCLLYMPFARRDFGGGKKVDLKRYALNRAVRIFPLYYAALIVVMLVLEDGGTFEEWWKFGLISHTFDKDMLRQVNPALWTIVAEFHFYLFLPLIAFAIGRLSGGSWRRGILLIFGLIAASLFIRWYFFLRITQSPNLRVQYSVTSTFYFVASGMLVAMTLVHWSDHGPPSWVRGWLARPDVWMLASVPLWLLFVNDYRWEPALAIASYLLLGGVMLPLGGPSLFLRVLQLRWLAVIGLASYSLYIWHVPMLRVITDEGQNRFAESFPLLLLVALPVCTIWALLSFRLIEAPALRLRKRWSGSTDQLKVMERKKDPEPASSGG